MKLSQLTSSDFTKIGKLIAEKDIIAQRLAKIEAEIDSYGLGGVSAPAPSGKRGRPTGLNKQEKPVKEKTAGAKRGPKKGQKPGALKDSIVIALKEAGSVGLTVGEIADKLKTKSNNIYSWFYTTGKNHTDIKKSADGKYTYVAPVVVSQ
jgi:hypothetical protein